jgi:DNA-binding NtrC family response regulator
MTETRRPRVFVVDDEPVIGFTLATILESAGYTARSFTDPLDALRAAETNCPDYLISDVIMPALNGIDLGIQFHAIYPDVKVLLFSGVQYPGRQWEKVSRKPIAFEVLAKPIHPKTLLSAIEALGK